MKKDLNAVLSDFKAWIIDNCQAGVGSAGSYADTYVPKLIENVLHPAFDRMISGFLPYRSFSNSAALAEIRRLIFAASEQIVSDAMSNAKDARAKRTLFNYRSGLRMFFRFMESENVYFDASLSKQKRAVLIGFVCSSLVAIKYSRDELCKTFKSRVTTWDRAYQKMLYPARLINRIFNSSSLKKEYKKLLDQVIAKIKFRVSSSVCIPLKNISSIAIYPKNKVEIKNDKETHALLTDDGAKNLCDMKALTVADLSIDHDVSLEKLLNTNIAEKEYPYLKELCDLYAENKTNDYLTIAGIRDFVNRTKKCYDQHKNDRFADPDFIDGLLKDLKKLYGKVKCTIMDKKANSRKGKN